MFAEIHPAFAIPFKHSLLYRPDQGQQANFFPRFPRFPRDHILEEGPLLFRGKLILQPDDLFLGRFDIDAYPVPGADNSRGIIPAMGNGKMKIFVFQKWFTRIRDTDQVIGKSRKKVPEKKPSGQMLQPFMGMADLAVQRYGFPEEPFTFLNSPYPYPGSIVDSMLKKNGHVLGFNPYFAGLQIDN